MNKNQNIVSALACTSFSCGKCDKQFSSKRGLDYHSKSVHEGKRYPCDQCDYKGREKSVVNQHVKSVHEG